MDEAPGSFEVLEEIADTVAGKVPIVFDSGVRCGEHIFKALAAGADIVALGRTVLFGLALGGWKEVKSVLTVCVLAIPIHANSLIKVDDFYRRLF